MKDSIIKELEKQSISVVDSKVKLSDLKIAKSICKNFLKAIAKTELTEDQINELSKGLLDYAIEMPEETFEVKATGSISFNRDDEVTEEELDKLEVKILDIKGLFEAFSEINVPYNEIPEYQVLKILGVLEGKSFKVSSEIGGSKIIRYGADEDSSEYERFDVDIVVEFTVASINKLENDAKVNVIKESIANIN